MQTVRMSGYHNAVRNKQMLPIENGLFRMRISERYAHCEVICEKSIYVSGIVCSGWSQYLGDFVLRALACRLRNAIS